MNATQIITPRWIAPVVPRQLLTDHSVVLAGEHILEVVPTSRARENHPGVAEQLLPSHLLTPGFINCHGHAAMTLLRGLADDREMMDWLTNWIWPVEAELVDAAFVYDGARLAALEMIMSGTTCAADTYFFPEQTARAFSDMGFRAQVAMPVIKFPNAWARDEDEHIHKGLAFRDSIRNSPLITPAFAPHSPYGVTDQGFERVRLYAEQLDMAVHLHLHETATEVADSITEFGVRPIARLQQLGIISPALQAVHMTQLRDDEIRLLASLGAQVVHCPESNMKLASGFCPVDKLLAAGINVAIGTDGAASNNDLDLLQEARTASLLSKAVSGDATSITADDALEMLTLRGARFLGLEDTLGSIEPGKLADLTAVNLEAATFQPIYNPISQLVYTATGRDVSHVWINGVPLMAERQLTRADTDAITSATARWQGQIKAALDNRSTDS